MMPSLTPPTTNLVLFLLLAALISPPSWTPIIAFCHAFSPPRSTGGGGGGRVRVRRSNTRLFVDGQGTAVGTGARHLVGDVLRSLQPRYLSQVADAVRGNARGMREIDTSGLPLDDDEGAPTWDDLSSLLVSAQTPAERRFRSDLEEGSGPSSSLADVRLFGSQSSSPPRVVLYRDSASWCPYCQKAWIALEERRVPYEVRRVDMRCYGIGKPAEFTRIQPNGNLPCAVVDGTTVIGESDDILVAVDALAKEQEEGGRAANSPLFPEDGTAEHDFMRSMVDDGRNSLERRLYTRWMYYLTGVRKPEEYRRLYEEHLDEAEEALRTYPDGPYFLGKDLSVIDVKFVPFIERQEASLAYFAGFRLRDEDRWPNLCQWLEAMEGRDSYKATKSDWYTHSRALPPQLSAECVEAKNPEAEEFRACIDAIPLGSSTAADPSHDCWVEPGWGCDESTVSSPKVSRAYRREAAERLLHNRERIAPFACRGAGLPGLPASAAPLADPRCVPNDGAKGAVDLFLRFAVRGLLLGAADGGGGGGGGSSGSAEAAAHILASSGSPDSADGVADCLDYLRSRIGVPRDMSYPAARELRTELRDLAEELRRAAATSAETEEKGEAVGSSSF